MQKEFPMLASSVTDNGEAVPGGGTDPDGRGFDGVFPYAVRQKHVKTK